MLEIGSIVLVSSQAFFLFHNTQLFSESIIYTLLSFVFPTIRLWPDSLLAFMVEVYSESLTLVGLHQEKW